MIVDLRDYTVQPAHRDELAHRCETLFFPEQERLGARFLGAFRDARDPSRFVFLRAMPDLPTRQRVLTEFYADGAMWRDNNQEVNSWLIDSDNVLLLRPVTDVAPPAADGPVVESVVGMYTHVGPTPLSSGEAADLRAKVEAAVDQSNGRMLATFETDPAENNYPRHPIRTGEHGLVWFATYAVFRTLDVRGVEQRQLWPAQTSRMR